MRTVTWQVSGGSPTTTEIPDNATPTQVRQIIQTALDNAAAAASDTQPATVTLSAGTFVVNGTGTASQGCLQVKSNVTLQGSQDGQGNWSKIDLDDAYTGAVTGVVRTPNNYGTSGEEPIHNVTIKNLVIEGSGTGATANVDGIYAGNYSGDPLVRDPARSQYNITIENVEVSQCSRYGIDPHEQISNLTITNCVSHDNGKDGFVLDYVEGGTLTNNEAYGNGRHGFNLVTGTYGIVMTGNIAHDNGVNEEGAGIAIQPPSADNDPRVLYSYDITVTGGAIYNNTGVGIRVNNGQMITIEDVNIYDNTIYGIRVGNQTRDPGDPVIPDADDVFLIANYIRNNGLMADDGSEIRIDDNVDDVTIVGNRLGSTASIDYVTGFNLGTITIDGNRYERGSVVVIMSESFPIPDDPATIGAMTFHSWNGQANTINYDAGRQYVKGNGGDDTISTGADKDTLLGNSGNDSLNGGSDTDALWGGTGNDTLDGGAGADKMHGGQGDDVFIVDNTTDIVLEGYNSGTDLVQAAVTYSIGNAANIENLTLTGSAAINGTGNGLGNELTGNTGANVLTGNSGADTMWGGNGADTINGNAAADKLYGQAGADVLSGGGGKDQLTGAGGNDTFKFSNLSDSGTTSATRDVISDFGTVSGNDDIIDVSGIDADAGVAGNQAFTWIGTAAFTGAGQLRYVVSGGNTIIQGNNNSDLGADFTIEITGTPSVTAADFIL
jgi:parallel beta-helix repeat protein